MRLPRRGRGLSRAVSERFRISLVQMHVSPRPEDNLALAMRALSASARRGVVLCILPELFTNRYVGQFPDTQAPRERLPDHRRLLADFGAAARKTRTAVLVPFAEVVDERRCYNALVLIDKSGEEIANYLKIHIPDSEGYREDLYFTPGDLGYVVARLDPVKIGLGICWDQWFPEVSRPWPSREPTSSSTPAQSAPRSSDPTSIPARSGSSSCGPRQS